MSIVRDYNAIVRQVATEVFDNIVGEVKAVSDNDKTIYGSGYGDGYGDG